jgi:hypothetical protein
MRRIVTLVLAAALFMPLSPADAADEEPSLSFFYPLVTRRPVIESEVELTLEHEKGAEGRETELAAALEIAILPRWQIELEVPLIFTDPRDGDGMTGVGDIEVATKVLLYKSVEHKAQIAAGVEVRLPTGSERRGLGGVAAIEPFITGGIALGEFDILAFTAYELNMNAHVRGPREEELTAGVATGYRLHRLFTPLLELTTVTRTRGDDDDGLRGRTQVYLTPGFNTRPWPGTTLRFGVQLPVTDAREFDYTLHAGFVKEF